MDAPQQLVAYLQTYIERRGTIQGRRVVFVGDGFNMCWSFMEAATILDFELHVAHPEGYGHKQTFIDRFNGHVEFHRSVEEAVRNADLVVTDVWSTMGHEGEDAKRRAAFKGFQVDENLLDRAKPDALFMHCLPAHGGEEANETGLDDPCSVR